MKSFALNASKKTKSTPTGEIPVDWSCVRLAEIVEALESGFSVAAEDRVASKTEPGVLKVSAVRIGRFFANENKAILPANRHQVSTNPSSGCVIISRSNTPELVGAVGYVSKDYSNLFLPDTLWQIRFRREAQVDGRWVSLVLTSDHYRKLIGQIASGTSANMKKLQKPSLLKLTIPLPPLAEQRKIAAILTTWDEGLEKLDALIEAKERRKKAIMQQLLSGRKRLKGFSGKWKSRPLCEHVRLELRPARKPNVPFKSLGIRSHGKGTFLKPNFDPAKIALDELYEVREGDLIVNITFAWEGAIAIAGSEDAGALVSHRFPTFVFVPGKSAACFIRHVMAQRWFREQLSLVSPGGAGRNRVLNKRDFLRIEVPTPPYDELLRIGEVLDTCDAELRLHRQQRAALDRQKRGLMQRLLTGKLRVSL